MFVHGCPERSKRSAMYSLRSETLTGLYPAFAGVPDPLPLSKPAGFSVNSASAPAPLVVVIVTAPTCAARQTSRNKAKPIHDRPAGIKAQAARKRARTDRTNGETNIGIKPILREPLSGTIASTCIST